MLLLLLTLLTTGYRSDVHRNMHIKHNNARSASVRLYPGNWYPTHRDTVARTHTTSTPSDVGCVLNTNGRCYVLSAPCGDAQAQLGCISHGSHCISELCNFPCQSPLPKCPGSTTTASFLTVCLQTHPHPRYSLVHTHLALVIALGSEVAVFVASFETHNIVKDVTGLSLSYVTLGIATSAVTVIPLLFILLRECTSRPVDVRTELLILAPLGSIWLSVGMVASRAQSHNFGHALCESFDPIPSSICAYGRPIVSYSLIAAGLMLSYGVFLLLIAGWSAWKKTPFLAHPLREKVMKKK
ncbi:hypothetical protein BC628DRAFT_1357157 [Trametes gibbosa]|nr:hypothetical protein BC628DRAFT_1357157 [Trametes gibbosa]